MSTQGRILFIDAYDSFSNNIVSLLRIQLGVGVETIKIDDPRFILNDDAFFEFLQHFDAVVAGPGPGHPANHADAGVISKLWSLPEDHLLPVLGICFGFQSLALHFGAKVIRLNEPRHGMVASLIHCGGDVFAETGEVVATRYHSLHVQLDGEAAIRKNRSLWSSSRSCKQLIPLAWDVTDGENGAILMALRHCHKPYWGVQYHPESICTNSEGARLISNWWDEAMAWCSSKPQKRDSMEAEAKPNEFLGGTLIPPPLDTTERTARRTVNWKILKLRSDMSIPIFVEELRNGQCEPIVLESGSRNGNPVNQETGRFSIIGLHNETSLHIRYSVKSHQLNVISADKVMSSEVVTMSNAFNYLSAFMREHLVTTGPAGVPFWGGLIGFISYEAGLETIGVIPSETKEDQPDVWFVFVEHSIVIDHFKGMLYIQSIRAGGDNDWLDVLERRLKRIHVEQGQYDSLHKAGASSIARPISAPEIHEYQKKVLTCQNHLRAGSSYELCLTDTTHIHTFADSWDLYLRLRASNPAPFGAYIRLPSSAVTMGPSKSAPSQGISIVSSSPERFLSWSRSGKCQFRPIKGTVKKTSDVTRAKAEELLNCPKERAENLMIVDLIRHDLNGVPGVPNVRVPKLMHVEEYETVFQLVSVVEGDLNGEGRASGVDVLAASLPPGSMTGAPKKRSCELLKEVENGKPRGLYSGVLGYLDVGGGGDFSVVIRTAFKWDDENDWRVGAGGAVTALSDPEAEWKEMNAKRESILGAFDLLLGRKGRALKQGRGSVPCQRN